MSNVISTIERFLLRAIIRHRMRAYPYGLPHPETVKAIEGGLCAVIDLSNARPAKYEQLVDELRALKQQYGVRGTASGI